MASKYPLPYSQGGNEAREQQAMNERDFAFVRAAERGE